MSVCLRVIRLPVGIHFFPSRSERRVANADVTESAPMGRARS
jgi:hypothetical protein